jgi:hypothetical protein
MARVAVLRKARVEEVRESRCFLAQTGSRAL